MFIWCIVKTPIISHPFIISLILSFLSSFLLLLIISFLLYHFYRMTLIHIHTTGEWDVWGLAAIQRRSLLGHCRPRCAGQVGVRKGGRSLPRCAFFHRLPSFPPYIHKWVPPCNSMRTTRTTRTRGGLECNRLHRAQLETHFTWLLDVCIYGSMVCL